MELSHCKKLSHRAKGQFRAGGKFARRPSVEAIRQRAVLIWRERVRRGGLGDHLSDWLTAEKEEITESYSKQNRVGTWMRKW